MVNHLTLSLLIGALVVLMMAIFVNYTERLILQLKEDVEKSFLITGHVINGEIKNVIEEIEKLKKEVEEINTRIEKLLETEATETPIDCTDINVNQGSGIYKIYPLGTGSFNVYCDMETNNTEGAWTVIQHRETGEEDFNRGWIEYEYGFGDIRKEFWLGNSKLNAISSQGRYELLILLEDEKNKRELARYDFFKIGNSISNYKLSIGEYSGTAG
ncbi:fibrinogen-like protein 1 [Mytilus galloprovincialis]|uniref:fibrinogen-like protein 1 n=1 Tax=Mytilus galloprovincialis TaxID=29158 RepID=UPI003F7B585C